MKLCTWEMCRLGWEIFTQTLTRKAIFNFRRYVNTPCLPCVPVWLYISLWMAGSGSELCLFSVTNIKHIKQMDVSYETCRGQDSKQFPKIRYLKLVLLQFLIVCRTNDFPYKCATNFHSKFRYTLSWHWI